VETKMLSEATMARITFADTAEELLSVLDE
jgi:hypothetical protein